MYSHMLDTLAAELLTLRTFIAHEPRLYFAPTVMARMLAMAEELAFMKWEEKFYVIEQVSKVSSTVDIGSTVTGLGRSGMGDDLESNSPARP